MHRCVRLTCVGRGDDLAGLAAHGVTKIEDIEHVQRGYEDIVEKFVGLGADMYLMLDPTNSDTAKIG